MIVTTALKAHAVHSLHDYMQVKGMYMKHRLDPNEANVPGYYEVIVSYIEKHTDMAQNRFWYELDNQQKLRFAKFLHFSDDVPNQFNIRSDDKQAQVCIVLNGSSDVITRITTDNPEQPVIEEKHTFHQGNTFGSFDVFDATYDVLVQQELESLNSPRKNFRLKEKAKAKKAEELARNGGKSSEPVPTVMTILMEIGTWLHIGIRDYKDFVLEIAPEPVELEEETDEQISGIPSSKMTAQDFTCVAVKRAAKRRLAETMFTFMSKQELIPHNAAVMSSEFVTKGSAGHATVLTKDNIYVLIDGKACLQVYLNSAPVSASYAGSDGRGQIIIGTERGPDSGDPFWSYKPAQTVKVVRRDMPLLLLEGGTIVNLCSTHFSIESLQSNVGGSGYRDERDNDTANVSEGGGPFLPPIGQKNGRPTSEKDKGDVTKGLYSLRFLNESAVTYLTIPRKTFMSALRDVPQAQADDILTQLRVAQELCTSRILPVLPWLQGALSVIQSNQHMIKAKPTETADGASTQGRTSTRGILGKNLSRSGGVSAVHPRDIPPVDVLLTNNKERQVRELLEGSFLTTDDLKGLVAERELEIDRVKRVNQEKRKAAAVARGASELKSGRSSPTGSRAMSPNLL